MNLGDQGEADLKQDSNRLFVIRAIDGFEMAIQGMTLDREEGFLLVRNSEGAIVYCTPERRVADVAVTPPEPQPPRPKQPRPAPTPSASPQAPRAPQSSSPPAETQEPPAQPVEGKRPAEGGPSNGGKRPAKKREPQAHAAENNNRAAGYLRADLDPQRAATFEQRLADCAEAAGFTLTALYRDSSSASTKPEEASGLARLIEDAREGFFSTVLLCAPAASARDVACIGELSTLLGECGLKLMVVGQDGVARPK